MSMTATTETDQQLLVGGVWSIGAVVLDSLGAPVAFPPPVTILPPSGAPVVLYPTAPNGDGRYSVDYTPAVVGRYVATMTSSVGVVAFSADVLAAVASPLVTLADLRGASVDRDDPDDLGYLGRNSWTDAQLQDALDAETSAQSDVCRIPAAYPASLRQALLRRVARNLAMRPLALAVLRGDAEAGESVVLPVRDPEVRRLEAPWRRLPMG